MHTIRYSEIDAKTSKDMPKFTSKFDLLQFAKQTTGEVKLKSFLIPDIKDLHDNLKMKIIPKAKSRTKDEFEHMVNWKRVFEQIWVQIRWLISYGQINELALKKILKKYVKNYFAIKDNTLKNKLQQLIDSKYFKIDEEGNDKTSEELRMLSDNLLTFYADCFHKGNRS